MEWIIAAGFASAACAAGATGAIFRPGEWYESLAKPSWTPPNLLFPIAWTILYILMSIAAWRVASDLADAGADSPASNWAAAGLGFWAAQITLNAMWSPLFFGARRPRAALICIAALWFAIFGAIYCFAHADAASAWLMAPYLAWASFAAALNLAVLRLNPNHAWGRADA